ncbi:MAG: tyrosine-type recombinase/integrase [Pseudomonadota bacterium]
MTYRRILPVEDWPATDRLAWEAARQPGDAFADAGGAAHWSTKNRRQIGKSYGRWLQYLKVSGQFAPETLPLARVMEQTLHGFVARLRQDQLSSETIFSTVRNVKDALRVMVPGADLRMLQRLVARLDRERVTSRNKPQRVEDPARLLDAGLRFIEEHAYSEQPGHHDQLRAGWARSGLVVALLACRPLRLANLTAITLGQHLHRRGNAWWLQFGAAETKERRPLELCWPSILTPLLEQYLSAWRPCLLRAESDALWISNRGRPMTDQAVYCQVVQVTKTMLGRPVNPHLFRDSALTAAAEHSPEQVALVSRLLGHCSLKTGEQHYNHARQLIAQRRYHADLLRLIDDRKPPSG